jgi:hypothetical protein
MSNETKCYCGHTTICDCGPLLPTGQLGAKAHEFAMKYKGTDKYTVSMESIAFGYYLATEDNSPDEELHTSEEWQKLYPNPKILDPDGWDRGGGWKYEWFEELINFETYQMRAMRSTVSGNINTMFQKVEENPISE